MNGVELKAARELLGLSVAEAAEHIGGVTRRSWLYFESGEVAIKADIAKKMDFLLNRRQEILKSVQAQMLRDDADLSSVAVVYYKTPEHCANVLDWRFSQSLARTLSCDYGAKLVTFDADKYFAWLGKRADNQTARSEWAAEQV